MAGASFRAVTRSRTVAACSLSACSRVYPGYRGGCIRVYGGVYTGTCTAPTPLYAVLPCFKAMIAKAVVKVGAVKPVNKPSAVKTVNKPGAVRDVHNNPVR